jgi:hypothetical protein
VVTLIIEAFKRKKNPMDEMITEFTTAESNHPVLQGMRDKITELQTLLDTNKATASALDTERVETIRKVRADKWTYEEKVKSVLVEALEDHDEDTVRYIAEQLDIQLTKTKSIEVNVTFTIEIEHEIGSEPDPEWDFEFNVSHSDIVDFQTDIIYSKDV